MCVREGDVEIFNWLSGSLEFFKARGQQNYLGQSIEHIVCMEGMTSIVDDIRPKLDTKDYSGNLPLYYTLMRDDVEMVQKYFTRGNQYFVLRNFKYETIFHVAAKHNSINSLKLLVGNTPFQEELIKRDFKGDTPLHAAVKAGSREVLEFFMTAVTEPFLQIQNDFGLTPRDALAHKLSSLSPDSEKHI